MGKRIIGITNGCFDPIHVGHVYFFSKCKLYANNLIVAVNSDESIKRLKGDHKPIYNHNERKFFLNSIRTIDSVQFFDTEEGLVELIKMIKPRYLFKGVEYRGKKITGAIELMKYGGEIIFIDHYADWSSTKLVNIGKNEKDTRNWRGSN